MPCVAPSWSCLGTGDQGAGVLQAYNASVGYDRASGLGSVNAENLVHNWPDSTAAFTSPTYTVKETGARVVISVDRVGSTLLPLYATWVVSDGDGIVGKDFTQASGNLTLLPGATTGSFVFNIMHNTRVGDRTVVLSIFPALGGTPSTTTITITNVDVAGTIQFLSTSVSAPTKVTGPSNLSLTVTRSGGGAGGVTVDFAATDNTAVAGTDYSVVSTSPLTFAAGQTSPEDFAQGLQAAPRFQPEVHGDS